jgi:hypothetical protein
MFFLTCKAGISYLPASRLPTFVLSCLPTFVVSGQLQLSSSHPRPPNPPPLPGGQGSMAWDEPPAQPRPSPHRGVEGPQRASVGQASTPRPRPPASPLRVEGRSSRRGGSTQQLTSPSPHTPSRAVPTWADVARGSTCTQREAQSISTADIIAIYPCCAAAGVQARFSIKNLVSRKYA